MIISLLDAFGPIVTSAVLSYLRLSAGRGACLGRISLEARALVHLVSVLLVSQVHLEIGCCRVWSRGVELARAVRTPDPGEEHVLHIIRKRLAPRYLWRRDDGGLCVGVYGAMSHCGLEVIIWPGLAQIIK